MPFTRLAPDAARAAAVARETLISMGHARVEVETLPDRFALELLRGLTRAAPADPEPCCCPLCGSSARYLGATLGCPLWQCDDSSCPKGSFGGVG